MSNIAEAIRAMSIKMARSLVMSWRDYKVVSCRCNRVLVRQ